MTAPFSSAVGDRGTRVSAGTEHAVLFGTAGNASTTSGRRGCERRRDEQADAHRLGEGVGCRREQAWSRVAGSWAAIAPAAPTDSSAPACAWAGKPPSEPSTSFE